MPTPLITRTVRHRCFFGFFIIFVTFIVIFNLPWELPSSLKGAGILLSGSNITQVVKGGASGQNVDEIYGLLYLVIREDEAVLSPDVDSSQPIALAKYSADQEKVDWAKTVKQLNEKYPIVVFSKSYCPFSKRAKELLETYKLHPLPKVIEVDLREDSVSIKNILSRLTRHSTFPNIILHGVSIGGSDNLYALHKQGHLSLMFEKAGAVLGGVH